MSRIMDVIANQTDGVSYKSHRFCYDSSPKGGIEYDPTNEADIIIPNGEGVNRKDGNISVKNLALDLAKEESCFKYFLDGSRHTYKIDDISYDKAVYPVIAGQIGVGCCSRENKNLQKEIFKRKLVIVLPDKARADWQFTTQYAALCKNINQNNFLKRIGVQFDEILDYSSTLPTAGATFETLGIARVQDAMIQQEKDVVAELVSKNKLRDDAMLIKDGSLQYQKMSKSDGKEGNDLLDKKFRARYENVIGVSKSFNPTKCYVGDSTSNNPKSDSQRVAKLKPFERTTVNMYRSPHTGGVWFAVWYARLRDAQYSSNVFDGVVKIEKIVGIMEDGEKPDDFSPDVADYITAHLMNERNPVCYGADGRWANHIYPIYLTERYIKSQYLSSNLFLELF